MPLVVEEEDLLKMGNGKRIALVGFLINLTIVFLFFNSIGAEPKTYYGQVVGLEFPILQIRAEDGRI